LRYHRAAFLISTVEAATADAAVTVSVDAAAVAVVAAVVAGAAAVAAPAVVKDVGSLEVGGDLVCRKSGEFSWEVDTVEVHLLRSLAFGERHFPDLHWDWTG
jgi:hypothetical protein